MRHINIFQELQLPAMITPEELEELRRMAIEEQASIAMGQSTCAFFEEDDEIVFGPITIPEPDYMEMEIKEIKEKFRLLQTITGKQHVHVATLAKECKVKQTDLMLFIENNPKLFSGAQYELKRKPIGFHLTAVYESPEENPTTQEWVDKQRNEKSKYVYVKEYDNYGRISGYYIQVDKEGDDRLRSFLWRNTADKLNVIVSRFNLPAASYVICEFGDSSTIAPTQSWEISIDQIDTLKSEGYTFNNFRPIT